VLKDLRIRGLKESYKKGDSDSILALSLAGDIVRCRSKRRQGYRWAGLLSFEKRLRGAINDGRPYRNALAIKFRRADNPFSSPRNRCSGHDRCDWVD